MTARRARLAGGVAGLLWVVLCLRWFDSGSAFRPGWLQAMPVGLVAVPAAIAAALWLRERAGLLWGPPLGAERRGLLLVVASALAFRLPLAWQGALGYTTADGALSGIVAIHLRRGIEHLVFVPHVPYSGSLKSHLAAVLSLVLDTPRAFTLASVLFYALFVAALFRLALLAAACRGPRAAGGIAVLAGLYAAFAPAFVTRYSLSNDGNYVEVLALGTWALWLAARWVDQPRDGSALALLGGLLLGLAFWCHILAILYATTFGLFLLWAAPRRGLRSAPWALLGFGLGYFPGLLWNLTNGFGSFAYVIPGGQPVAGVEQAPSALLRLRTLVTDQWPVLMGYDLGYPRGWDRLMLVVALLAALLALIAVVLAARAAWSRPPGALAILVGLVLVDSVVAFVALPQVPRNPRYLLFLMSALPILLARLLGSGRRLWLFGLLLALGVFGSLAQLPPSARGDRRLRELVFHLEREGVRYCYTDFYLATPINFASEERVICSAKLGPTTTEYFFAYRRAVEEAPEAAFVAVNQLNADKLERRLTRLGVRYQRREWMKPVLLHLSRKVDPQELFPDRDFPLR